MVWGQRGREEAVAGGDTRGQTHLVKTGEIRHIPLRWAQPGAQETATTQRDAEGPTVRL